MQFGTDAGIAVLMMSGEPTRDRVSGRSVLHAGMGIVLDSRHVMTCAHVVNAALARPNESATSPTETVRVAFPLSRSDETLEARVVVWRPMHAKEGASDVAILELEEPVPLDVGHAKFVRTQQTAPGGTLQVFGIRAGSESGSRVEARFMGKTRLGEAQIDGIGTVGVFVQGGFSGSAAWDVAARGVAGMVVARDSDLVDRVAYIVPTSTLQEVWPALGKKGQIGLPDVFVDLLAERTKGFEGREHLFAQVEGFLADPNWSSGYLTVIGDPGFGKSALLGELTKRMSCVSHFFIRAEGITKAEQFYAYIGAQLHERYGVDTTASMDDAPGVRLKRWLSQAAEQLAGEKLILVVDALDECEETSRADRSGNLLFLPRVLPRGVFFILSRRDLHPHHFHIKLETEAGVGNVQLILKDFPSENRHDIERYLRRYFAENPKHNWLLRHNKTAEEGVRILTERSDSNFMYLRHILPHLHKRPESFAPETLPKGLLEYYQGHWERMTAQWHDKPEAQSVFATIYVLAVAQKPITRGQIKGMLAGNQEALVGTLIGQWREFLDEVARDETTYRIYHASFAEFLTDPKFVPDAPVRLKSAAQMLTGWFLNRFVAGRVSS